MRIKELWKDPVVSKLIANSIWVLLAVIMGLSWKIEKLNFLLKKEIPLYLILILLVIIFIIISLFLFIFGKPNFKKSNRYNHFNIGDIVQMKSGGFSSKLYTVIDKRHYKIIAVDDTNQQQEFSPDALFSTQEREDHNSKNREAMRNRRNRI